MIKYWRKRHRKYLVSLTVVVKGRVKDQEDRFNGLAMINHLENILVNFIRHSVFCNLVSPGFSADPAAVIRTSFTGETIPARIFFAAVRLLIRDIDGSFQSFYFDKPHDSFPFLHPKTVMYKN